MYYEVIDDFIPKIDQDRILSIIGEENFPWAYNHCTIYEEDSKPQMVHSFVHDGKFDFMGDQNLFQFIKGVLPFPEWDTHKLLRCKFNLNLALRDTKIITPHVDGTSQFKDGVVYLYYVEDSDGPTRIWPSIDNWGEEKNIIKKFFPAKVQPKKGRIVKMSHLTWHSSDIPRKFKRRIVGNFLFVK